MAQKKRTKKTSQGVHGGGGKGAPLSEAAKVLLGGGLLRSSRPIGSPVPEAEPVVKAPPSRAFLAALRKEVAA